MFTLSGNNEKKSLSLSVKESLKCGLGQGNIFTCVCLSTGVWDPGGGVVCLWTPPTVNKRVVRILLEYFLVFK